MLITLRTSGTARAARRIEKTTQKQLNTPKKGSVPNVGVSANFVSVEAAKTEVVEGDAPSGEVPQSAKHQRSEPALHAPRRRMFNNADTKKNQKHAARQTIKVSALFLTPEPRSGEIRDRAPKKHKFNKPLFLPTFYGTATGNTKKQIISRRTLGLPESAQGLVAHADYTHTCARWCFDSLQPDNGYFVDCVSTVMIIFCLFIPSHFLSASRELLSSTRRSRAWFQ